MVRTIVLVISGMTKDYGPEYGPGQKSGLAKDYGKNFWWLNVQFQWVAIFQGRFPHLRNCYAHAKIKNDQ